MTDETVVSLDSLTREQSDAIAHAAVLRMDGDKASVTAREKAKAYFTAAGYGAPGMTPAHQKACEAAFRLCYIAAYIAPKPCKALTPALIAAAQRGIALKNPSTKGEGEKKSPRQFAAERASNTALFRARADCGVKSLTPRAARTPSKDKAAPAKAAAPAPARTTHDVLMACLAQAQALDGMVKDMQTTGVVVPTACVNAVHAFRTAMVALAKKEAPTD